MATQTTAKAAVRSTALAHRRAMSPADRQVADAALIREATALVRGLATVAAHVPMPGEPGGEGLIGGLTAVVSTLLLPAVRPDRDLSWIEYGGDLGPRGALGLREAIGADLGIDALACADAVLVPAVAVDRQGRRLGRGGGSYDRALARVNPGVPVVALLYDGELIDDVPTEEHDRPVTAVLLPTGLHTW